MHELDQFGVDPEKCARRNRLAALRFGVNTVEIFKAQPVPKGYSKLDFARGSLPKTKEEALARINALLPSTAAPLKAEDVILLPLMEAANNNFVGDRYMFIGSSTLRNIQRDAEQGFAFMNSHRTGNVSTPAEQPYGKTFASRYERYASDDPKKRPFERTQLAVYMIKGVRPNGDQGPTTDDLAAAVDGGTAPMVSMGINGGRPVCDVCGYEVRSENCKHVPGTGKNLTPEQSMVQRARGVNHGHASYTLEDGHGHEVSAVYKGAVPGAGFSKAVDYAKLGSLSPLELRQAATSYRTLLAEGDFGMNIDPEQVEEFTESLAARIARKLGFKPNPKAVDHQYEYVGDPIEGEELTTLEPIPTNWMPATSGANGYTFRVTQSTPIAAATVADTEKLELQRQNNEMREKLEQLALSERLSNAEKLVDTILSDRHILPSGVPALTALALLLGNVGATIPETLEYQDATGATRRLSPTELLSTLMSDVPQHSLLSDHEFTDLPEDAVLLRGLVGTTDEAFVAEALEDVAGVVEDKSRRNGSRAASNGHKP